MPQDVKAGERLRQHRLDLDRVAVRSAFKRISEIDLTAIHARSQSLFGRVAVELLRASATVVEAGTATGVPSFSCTLISLIYR